jgi:hypothetical protein
MTAFHEPRLEPATALQDEPNNHPTKGSDFSSATANVRAFQAKLLEVAQANMQFGFEFAQRLATIKSPVEFISVTAEFMSKRSAMFLKHSKEIAESSIGRRTALWGYPFLSRFKISSTQSFIFRANGYPSLPDGFRCLDLDRASRRQGSNASNVAPVSDWFTFCTVTA